MEGWDTGEPQERGTEQAAQDLLESIFKVAADLVRGERASLMLRESDEAHFVIAKARGLAEEVMREVRVREGEGIAGKVAATKQPVFVRSGEGANRPTYRSDSFISVPILVADRAQGVLNVTDREGGEPFEQSDLETLQLLASHIAACLVQQRFDDHLQEMAESDPLTRLFNRRHFDRRLAAEFDRSRRTGEPLGLLMIDVNSFKEINDRLGHGAGDDVLSAVADAIRGAVRNYDVPVRYGGDEFAVILPNTDVTTATLVGERVVGTVAARAIPSELLAAVPGVGLSVGVATAPPAEEPRSLVERADAAMYQAKGSGGGVAQWRPDTPLAPAQRRERRRGLPAPYLADPARLAKAALQALVPDPLAEEWNVLVIGREGTVITVAMPEPSTAAVEALSNATGYAIYPVYSDAHAIERARRSVS